MSDQKAPRKFWVRPPHDSLPFGACVEEKTLGGIEVTESAPVESLLREKDLEILRLNTWIVTLRAEVERLKADQAKWRQFDAFLKEDGDVSAKVYESAVKGRQEFRQALKETREQLTAIKTASAGLVVALEWYEENGYYNQGETAKEALAKFRAMERGEM